MGMFGESLVRLSTFCLALVVYSTQASPGQGMESNATLSSAPLLKHPCDSKSSQAHKLAIRYLFISLFSSLFLPESCALFPPLARGRISLVGTGRRMKVTPSIVVCTYPWAAATQARVKAVLAGTKWERDEGTPRARALTAHLLPGSCRYRYHDWNKMCKREAYHHTNISVTGLSSGHEALMPNAMSENCKWPCTILVPLSTFRLMMNESLSW